MNIFEACFAAWACNKYLMLSYMHCSVYARSCLVLHSFHNLCLNHSIIQKPLHKTNNSKTSCYLSETCVRIFLSLTICLHVVYEKPFTCFHVSSAKRQNWWHCPHTKLDDLYATLWWNIVYQANNTSLQFHSVRVCFLQYSTCTV